MSRPCLSARWRQTYNRIRLHTALGYQPPARQSSLHPRNTPFLNGNPTCSPRVPYTAENAQVGLTPTELNQLGE